MLNTGFLLFSVFCYFDRLENERLADGIKADDDILQILEQASILRTTLTVQSKKQKTEKSKKPVLSKTVNAKITYETSGKYYILDLNKGALNESDGISIVHSEFITHTANEPVAAPKTDTDLESQTLLSTDIEAVKESPAISADEASTPPLEIAKSDESVPLENDAAEELTIPQLTPIDVDEEDPETVIPTVKAPTTTPVPPRKKKRTAKAPVAKPDISTTDTNTTAIQSLDDLLNDSKKKIKAIKSIQNTGRSKTIGEDFWAWLCKQLEEQSIEINHKEALTHVVEEGLLLVSPRIFEVAQLADQFRSVDNYTKIQNSFFSLNKHRILQTPTKTQNVAPYKTAYSTSRNTLKGVVIKFDALPSTINLPEVNRSLRLGIDQNKGQKLHQ